MNLRPATQAVLDTLTAAGLHVGDHVAPQSPDGRIVAPCVVVYSATSPKMTPSIAGGDATLARWRIVSTAWTAGEALDVAGRVEAALHDQVLHLDGGSIRVRCRSSTGVEPDSTTTPPLYYATGLYQAPIS